MDPIEFVQLAGCVQHDAGCWVGCGVVDERVVGDRNEESRYGGLIIAMC